MATSSDIIGPKLPKLADLGITKKDFDAIRRMLAPTVADIGIPAAALEAYKRDVATLGLSAEDLQRFGKLAQPPNLEDLGITPALLDQIRKATQPVEMPPSLIEQLRKVSDAAKVPASVFEQFRNAALGIPELPPAALEQSRKIAMGMPTLEDLGLTSEYLARLRDNTVALAADKTVHERAADLVATAAFARPEELLAEEVAAVASAEWSDSLADLPRIYAQLGPWERLAIRGLIGGCIVATACYVFALLEDPRQAMEELFMALLSWWALYDTLLAAIETVEEQSSGDG